MPSDVREQLPAIRALGHAVAPLRRYHRHRVVGMENVPRTGGALLVVHHSFATYDGTLLCEAILRDCGRLATALGDDLIFRLPGIAGIAHDMGIRPASPASGRELLEDGHLVYLAPGGMAEALRPTRDRYQIRWEGRRGFVRLALRTGAPIVLAACPAADDIYSLYDNPLTRAMYHRLRLPLPLIRGLGPTLCPRPVQLTHYVAPPIHPPQHDPHREDEQVDALHRLASRTMCALLNHEPAPRRIAA